MTICIFHAATAETRSALLPASPYDGDDCVSRNNRLLNVLIKEIPACVHGSIFAREKVQRKSD